jgi:acyl-CoA synthetase (AMP-forming)/AMP-acid ligase II
MKFDPAATGILVPGMEVRVIRDDGQEADFDEPGELWFKGDTISPGYWGNEKATKEAYTPDGWFKSGDMFRVSKEGLFYFADRAKDTLKVSGSQVSPFEIENVLMAHPAKLIVDASVAGVQGHGRTSDEKVPRAWVVLTAKGKEVGAQETVRQLEAWSKENLSKYKWLRGGIEVVDEIPKTPTGKVLRRVLVERYEQKLKEKAKL